MIFRQITHDDLGCASYLVGDDDAGVAVVVAAFPALARFDAEEVLATQRAGSPSPAPAG